MPVVREGRAKGQRTGHLLSNQRTPKAWERGISPQARKTHLSDPKNSSLQYNKVKDHCK